MRSEFPSNAVPEHIQPTHSAFCRTRHLERNAELGISFHVLEQNLLPAPVIEFRGPAVGVAGDSLSSFKSSVIRDTCRSERVRRIVRRQSSLRVDGPARSMRIGAAKESTETTASSESGICR